MLLPHEKGKFLCWFSCRRLMKKLARSRQQYLNPNLYLSRELTGKLNTHTWWCSPVSDGCIIPLWSFWCFRVHFLGHSTITSFYCGCSSFGFCRYDFCIDCEAKPVFWVLFSHCKGSNRAWALSLPLLRQMETHLTILTQPLPQRVTMSNLTRTAF